MSDTPKKQVDLSGAVARQTKHEARHFSKIASDAAAMEVRLAKVAYQGAKASGIEGVTEDSFVNFAQKMGVGADNPLTTAGYGFNPITRVRTTLEWVHRGSWIGGVAIDLVADDMTRQGVDLLGKMKPQDISKVHRAAMKKGVWLSLNAAYKWGRLYGGALAIMMIEGQTLRSELRPETVGRDKFKGLIVIDRWWLEPTLTDVVQEPGPDFGLPKFYKVRGDSPGLRNQTIHYSRVFRLTGIELPYAQAMMENMWGESILERLWDRMTGFDAVSTGIAQLVYKAWIRTYKIDGLRNIVSAGGKPLQGLLAQVDLMRRMSNSEGVVLMDMKDEMEAMQTVPFSGLSDAALQIGQQLSGALQIPLVRLFGQSPAGLNATGESDLRMYYDNIKKEQNKSKREVTRLYEAIARSEGVDVPDDFEVDFRSLWQLTETEKAEIADKTANAVTTAEAGGLICQQTGMQELKQSSRITGIFSNITDEQINSAEESLPPAGEAAIETELGNEVAMEGERVAGQERLQEGQHGHEVSMAKRAEQAAERAAAREAKAGKRKAANDSAAAVEALEARAKTSSTGYATAPTKLGDAMASKRGDGFVYHLGAKRASRDRLVAALSTDAMDSVAALKWFHDLDVVIESWRNSVRRGKGPIAWEAILAADYGYVRRTIGDDLDPIDCFVGGAPASTLVWIIHQVDPETRAPDEDKCLLGFRSRAEAVAAYRASYTDDAGRRIGGITELEMPDFKVWLSLQPDRRTSGGQIAA